MTPEAQRRAIAEACGWKLGRNEPPPPNYLGDLNAMHEVDSKLSANESSIYALELQKIISRDGKMGSLAIVELCIYATAAQRAEAFLCMLNKWVD